MRTNDPVSLNLNVRGIEPSSTLAINDQSQRLERAGRRVFKLGLGQSPFPVPVSVVDALKQNAHHKEYLPAQGLPELRRAVVDFHRRKDGLERDPADVLIGPGSKELMFLLQLSFYGELILPTPCWVSYVPQARILGRTVSLIETQASTEWRVTAEQLRRHCESQHDKSRPRILVLNYPNNPVGNTFQAEQLAELADVAREYKVVLLSDEIYGQLHHKGTHVSIARYYPEGTIISSGLSKWCGAGGWRLGTFAFPDTLRWLVDSMTAVASETYTSVCAPVQYAAVTAFETGVGIERYLWHVRRVLAALGNRCADKLLEAGIRVAPPTGGFYLFADFDPLSEKLAGRGIDSSTTLCDRLLEDTGVAVLPGVAFERPARELSARLAYVDFDGAKALTASETLPLDAPLPADFVDAWCFPMLDAIDRLADWARG